MRTTSVAAIDLGATSGRVVVGRVGPDILDTLTVTRFPNVPVATPDGLHWNILRLYGDARLGLREAFRADPLLASVGVDSWAVDYALLRKGRLLGEPFHYRDARSNQGVPIVHSRSHHQKLFARNGLQFLPFNTLYQLATEPRAVLDFADQLLLIPDLMTYWLTGAAHAEVTNASTTGLLHDGRWDDLLMDRLGLPRHLLADIVHPGQEIGPLLPSVAEDVGGNAPVVTVGSHDTASAVVAVPMDATTAAYISCGTWGLVGVEIQQPLLTETVRLAGFTNEGGVDGRTRLLHNVMGLWLLEESRRAWGIESGDLAALLDAAAAVRAPVAVFDPNDRRFAAPGDIPARIKEWCVEHGVAPPRTPAETVRSIIESLAQAFAEAIHRASALSGRPVTTIHLVGGGARNTLLCQRTADRAGLPVVAGPVEATALGNVLIQARTVGAIDGSLEDLRDLVMRTQHLTTFQPA